MMILVVLSLLSPNSAILFAKSRIDMVVEQMIYNAAYQTTDSTRGRAVCRRCNKGDTF